MINQKRKVDEKESMEIIIIKKRKKKGQTNMQRKT